MTYTRWVFSPPNGTALTTANFLSSQGVAATSITTNTGTATTSSDHPHSGGTGGKFAAAASSNDIARLPFPGTASLSAAWEVYFWFASAPTAQERLFAPRSSTAPICRGSITTAGKFAFEDSAGATVFTSATTVTGQLIRAACYATVATSTTGSAHVALYAGDSTTPLEAAYDSTATLNLGTTAFSAMDVGRISTGAQVTTVYVDDLQMDDGRTTEIGPLFIPAGIVQSQAVQRAALR